jgi:hypothetical protein
LRQAEVLPVSPASIQQLVSSKRAVEVQQDVLGESVHQKGTGPVGHFSGPGSTISQPAPVVDEENLLLLVYSLEQRLRDQLDQRYKYRSLEELALLDEYELPPKISSQDLNSSSRTCRLQTPSALANLVRAAVYHLTAFLYPKLHEDNQNSKVTKSASVHEQEKLLSGYASDFGECVEGFLAARLFILHQLVDEVCIHGYDRASDVENCLKATEELTKQMWHWAPFRPPRKTLPSGDAYIHWVEVSLSYPRTQLL